MEKSLKQSYCCCCRLTRSTRIDQRRRRGCCGGPYRRDDGRTTVAVITTTDAVLLRCWLVACRGKYFHRRLLLAVGQLLLALHFHQLLPLGLPLGCRQRGGRLFRLDTVAAVRHGGTVRCAAGFVRTLYQLGARRSRRPIASRWRWTLWRWFLQ